MAGKLVIHLLLAGLLCVPACLRAQDPVYLHYTIDEGLPSNEVYDSFEDSLGYIWFATDHGISRFDGYSFRNYSTSDGLVHNTVFGFHTDQQGRMWMRTFNSMLCFMENGTIYPYKHNDALKTFLGRDFIQQFALDKSGNLWFVSIRKMMGLFRQDAATGKIEKVALPRGFNAFIRELDSGDIIAGVDLDNGYVPADERNDTICYKDNTWLFRLPEPGTTAGRTGARAIVRCLQTGKNSFIFTYDVQLVLIGNGLITCRAEFPEIINDNYVEPGGQLWLCMTGCTRFDPAAPVSGDRILQNMPCTNVLSDRAGNYWFTTINNGVFFARNMQVAALDRIAGQALGELRDLDIYGDQLVTLDHTGAVFRFGITPTGIDTAASERWPEEYPGANLLFCSPASNRVYFKNCGYKVNGARFSSASSRRLDKSFFGAVRGYAQTGDSLLMAGNNGWLVTDMDGAVRYHSIDDGFSSFCTAIATNGKNTWIGTADGLFIFSGGKTIPFEPGNLLFRQRVTDIEFGKNGEVFVSTRGDGLIVIDGVNRYNLRPENGLSSDQCENICVDDSVLWICSNTGLNRVAMLRSGDRLTFRIEVIDTQHGLPSNLVSDAVRAGDLLFVATGKGLAWFDVRRFRQNASPPAVYVTSFLANNRETDPLSTTLRWNDNNISVGFIALLYQSPGNVNYRYRLEGYEQAWNYTKERMARYFNLPPGEYTFAVSAMNENGVWNDRPARIHFSIPAHFTQTAWFRVLVIVLVAGVASGLVFFFVRQQRDRARSGLALAEAEQKALRDQMKPHFIFNSLNSIQHFILDRDEESAHLYLSRFSNLMRKTLENTQRNTISLSREIETLRLYLDLEKLRFGKNFSYEISIASTLLPDMIELPPMLIQPYVENAIWHGLLLCRDRDPRLLLQFLREKSTLVCIVEDNGIGRKKAEESKPEERHKPTGMRNIEERILILNKVMRSSLSVEVTDLYNDSGEPSGTRVTLRIPLFQFKKENARR